MIVINIFGEQFTVSSEDGIEHHNTAADHVFTLDADTDSFFRFFHEHFDNHLSFAVNGRIKSADPERNGAASTMACAMLEFNKLWLPADRKRRSIKGTTAAARRDAESKESAAVVEQTIISRLSNYGPMTKGVLINRLKSIDRDLVIESINRLEREKVLFIAQHTNSTNGRKVLTIHIQQ